METSSRIVKYKSQVGKLNPAYGYIICNQFSHSK